MYDGKGATILSNKIEMSSVGQVRWVDLSC